jgi:hypothetical protein
LRTLSVGDVSATVSGEQRAVLNTVLTSRSYGGIADVSAAIESASAPQRRPRSVVVRWTGRPGSEELAARDLEVDSPPRTAAVLCSLNVGRFGSSFAGRLSGPRRAAHAPVVNGDGCGVLHLNETARTVLEKL